MSEFDHARMQACGCFLRPPSKAARAKPIRPRPTLTEVRKPTRASRERLVWPLSLASSPQSAQRRLQAVFPLAGLNLLRAAEFHLLQCLQRSALADCGEKSWGQGLV